MSTNAELKARAKASLKPQFGTAFLAAIAMGVVTSLVGLVPGVGALITLLITGPLAVGSCAIYMSITKNQTASVNQLFAPFSNCFMGCFITSLLETILIALWSLLLVIPGIMKAYSYSMSYYIVNKEGITGKEALDRSSELMNGHRMDLFMLQLSFILWGLLGIVTFGLAFIWVSPYMTTTTTEFFDEIYEAAVPAYVQE